LEIGEGVAGWGLAGDEVFAGEEDGLEAVVFGVGVVEVHKPEEGLGVLEEVAVDAADAVGGAGVADRWKLPSFSFF